MRTTAAFPEWAMVLGMIAAAALAAGSIVLRGGRARAVSMLGALALTPVVLVAEIWESPQFQNLRDRPTVVAIAAGVGLAAIGALVLLLTRRPALLALLVAAALPFRIPIEAGGATANLLVPLYVVIAGGALAWALPRLRDGDEERSRGPLEWLLAGAVVLYALQAAYSSDISKALEQEVFFYVPFAVLFSLLRELPWTPRLVRRALVVLVVLGLVFAAVGFVEYQQRHLLLNPKVIASNQFESYFRVNSLFFDPNIYGRFLALVMIGLAAALLWAKRPRTQWLVIAALAVLWGGLLLTLSQSSFAALVLGLAVLAALRWRPRRTLWAGAAVLVIAAVVVIAFPSSLRLDLGRKGLDDATSGRYGLISGGVGLVKDRPVLGWGAGSFSREFRRHEKTSTEKAVSASHTIPVTVAAEQGLVGLAVYLALLAAALWRLLKGAAGRPARAAVGAAFAALILHTWLYAAFLEDPLTWALLGLGTALASLPAPERDPEVAEPAALAA
jgi:O-antigen ligase